MIKIIKPVLMSIIFIFVITCNNQKKHFYVNIDDKSELIYKIEINCNDSIETRMVYLKRNNRSDLKKSDILKVYFSELVNSKNEELDILSPLSYSDWFANIAILEDGIIRYSDYARKKKRYLIKYPVVLNNSWKNKVSQVNIIDTYKITSIDTVIKINEKKYMCIEVKVKRKLISDMNGDILYEDIILYIDENHGLVYLNYWHWDMGVTVSLLGGKEE